MARIDANLRAKFVSPVCQKPRLAQSLQRAHGSKFVCHERRVIGREFVGSNLQRRTGGRDETHQTGRRVYCLDLLCRLTFSAVRRIRFLMSACSLRARDSVSPTTTSVAPIRRAVSASANQRAPSFELMGVTPRVPRSSGGKVGRGAEVVGFFTNWLRCHKGELPFDTELCVLPPRVPVEIALEVCTRYNAPKFGQNGTRERSDQNFEILQMRVLF